MKTLYLLDAYALIYRAYYGLIRAPRINSKGQNTSAVFGFLNTLREVLQKAEPDYIAVVFDPPGGTFRHEAYPEYKAQREATPEDIRFAVPYIKRLVEAYRIKMLEVKGYEADDVIGTMAKRAAREHLEVTMITPDKDYAQLVEEHIKMCRPGSGSAKWEVLGPEEVCNKYKLNRPEQMIDYLALVGDNADNVPGCPGVGPKTAEKLLAQYETCEGIIKKKDEIKGALGKKIREHCEEISFSKFLVTIKTDTPVDVSWEEMRYVAPNEEELQTLFEELEFRSMLRKIEKKNEKRGLQRSLFDTNIEQVDENDEKNVVFDLKTTNICYQRIDSQGDVRKNVEELCKCQKIGISVKKTKKEAAWAEIEGVALCSEEGKVIYIDVSRGTLFSSFTIDLLRPLFEDDHIEKVGHDLKDLLVVLSNHDLTLRGEMFDTMLAHYLIQPEMRHSLSFVAESYLHMRLTEIEPLKRGQILSPQQEEERWRRVCEEADAVLRLQKPLEEKMKEDKALRLFEDIEMPLMPVLAKMEIQGVRVDEDVLEEVGSGFNERLEKLEKEIYELAGHEFLISSPKQVGEVLFGELKLKEKPKKTKSGNYQTGEDVLMEISNVNPIVQKILDFRGLRKLLSTYIEALPKLIHPRTQHIHSSFNQAVTATGRLSSSNPNLQNIPVRGDDGREIRKAFVPEKDEIFFSADYSQIELRIMAHMSQDEHMINAFNEGKDIHAATAARIFKKSLEEISADERRKAKTANFGIIYGISAFGLAERLQVSRTEAKELIDSYFVMFPRIADYMRRAVEEAKAKGYIETLFGRRRYLADINSKNAVVRGYAERNAINAPIQGTAADIIKIAMVRVQNRIEKEHLRAKMILQVHDELNFSVPIEELELVRRIVKEEMEGAFEMRVPLIVDCGEGNNWLEAH